MKSLLECKTFFMIIVGTSEKNSEKRLEHRRRVAPISVVPMNWRGAPAVTCCRWRVLLLPYSK